MLDWLASAAQSRPDGIAVVGASTDETLTYQSLNEQVARYAARLAHLGVQRGDRVGVLMISSIDQIRLIHALARIGAVRVALNTRLTHDERRYQVDLAGCAWLVHDNVLRVQAALLNTPSCIMIHIDAMAASEIAPVDTDFGGKIDLDAVAAIMFTSGTTGTPKGVQITFGNLFYSAMASACRIGTLPDDRWLLCLPLYHIGGLSIVFRCCLYNTTVVHLPDVFYKKKVLGALKRHAVTLVSLVPTQLYRLMQSLPAGEGLSERVRVVLIGGAAASPALLEEAAHRGIPVAVSYGLTEVTSQVATTLPNDSSSGVGKPLMFTRVQIMDERGAPLPAGEYGDIMVSGPSVMKGYLGQPDTGGVFRTGDIGYLNERGDLHIVVRRTDLIVTGGENVYPAEVEAVLRTHPAIADVVVVGVPSAEWGQQVAAAVIVRDGMTIDADTLIAFARLSLAGYKIPRLIRFVSELPATATGKINRAAVQQHLSADDTGHPPAMG